MDIREQDLYNWSSRPYTGGMEKDIAALQKILRYQKRRIDNLLERVRKLEKKARK